MFTYLFNNKKVRWKKKKSIIIIIINKYLFNIFTTSVQSYFNIVIYIFL